MRDSTAESGTFPKADKMLIPLPEEVKTYPSDLPKRPHPRQSASPVIPQIRSLTSPKRPVAIFRYVPLPFSLTTESDGPSRDETREQANHNLIISTLLPDVIFETITPYIKTSASRGQARPP